MGKQMSASQGQPALAVGSVPGTQLAVAHGPLTQLAPQGPGPADVSLRSKAQDPQRRAAQPGLALLRSPSPPARPRSSPSDPPQTRRLAQPASDRQQPGRSDTFLRTRSPPAARLRWGREERGGLRPPPVSGFQGKACPTPWGQTPTGRVWGARGLLPGSVLWPAADCGRAAVPPL